MKVLILATIIMVLVGCNSEGCGDVSDCAPTEPSLALIGEEFELPIPIDFSEESIDFTIYTSGIYFGDFSFDIALDAEHRVPDSVETEEQLYQLIKSINEQLTKKYGTQGLYLIASYRGLGEGRYLLRFDDVNNSLEHKAEITTTDDLTQYLGLSVDIEAVYEYP